MKRKTLLMCVTALCTFSMADVVELQDGTRIEGTILAENEDSIEIEIGTNDRGTIRRVLIIDSTEVRTWMADAAGRRTGQRDDTVQHLSGQAYIDRLINEAQGKIDDGKYDDGIREFGEAAELAGQDVQKLEPADRIVLLEKKAYAYRLQLAALKGREHMLEEGADDAEDKLEELQKSLEKDIRDFQSDKADYIKKQEAQGHNRIGSRRAESELNEREERLLRRQAEFIRLRDATVTRIEDMRQDLTETKMQLELAEERVDQAEDDARRAERSLR